MRLAVNLTLSLGMLALCLWLVWPDAQGRAQLGDALSAIELADFWPYLAGYLGLMLVVHFARAWRWNNLLAPLGVRIAGGRLLAISSVGFMAILALPARMGEFVRPGLIRQRGEITASAALGTVAVERIVDGLLVSLLVFGTFVAIRGPGSPGWMMPTAYIALGVFTAAFVFLVFAMNRPEATVRFCLRLSLLPRFAPRVAKVIEEKLLEMIRGFAALRDRRNMAVFLGWSLLYWFANGLTLWVLARGLGLPFDLLGAFAAMGLIAVGITLPNSPGMVGQFQWFTLLGLSLSWGPATLDGDTRLHAAAFALAILHHGLQVLWYLGMGGLGLASKWVAVADLWPARKLATSDAPRDAPG